MSCLSVPPMAPADAARDAAANVSAEPTVEGCVRPLEAVMSWKYVIPALIAPFLVCLVLVPFVFATAQRDVAAGINEQTLKAAAECKRPERNWAPLRLFHSALHPLKERE